MRIFSVNKVVTYVVGKNKKNKKNHIRMQI